MRVNRECPCRLPGIAVKHSDRVARVAPMRDCHEPAQREKGAVLQRPALLAEYCSALHCAAQSITCRPVQSLSPHSCTLGSARSVQRGRGATRSSAASKSRTSRECAARLRHGQVSKASHNTGGGKCVMRTAHCRRRLATRQSVRMLTMEYTTHLGPNSRARVRVRPHRSCSASLHQLGSKPMHNARKMAASHVRPRAACQLSQQSRAKFER